MRRLGLAFLVIVFAVAAYAAPHFPELTGRVVDNAHILSHQAQDYLGEKLAAYERGTSNQIVVATLPDLGGYQIEEYGYQLLRHWGIGQKGKNNGAILIVVPSQKEGESRARIEVGYGLEGVLTDAASSGIIRNVFIPAVKDKDYERAVIDSTQAMLDVLGGKSVVYAQGEQSGFQTFLGLVFLAFFIWFAIRHPFIAYMLLSDSRFGGSSSGRWSDSDNFRGGGGSAGGGGASGRW